LPTGGSEVMVIARLRSCADENRPGARTAGRAAANSPHTTPTRGGREERTGRKDGCTQGGRVYEGAVSGHALSPTAAAQQSGVALGGSGGGGRGEGEASAKKLSPLHPFPLPRSRRTGSKVFALRPWGRGRGAGTLRNSTRPADPDPLTDPLP